METIHSRIKDYQYDFVDQSLVRARELIYENNLKPRKAFFFIDKGFASFYKNQLKAILGDDPVCFIEAHENEKDYLNLAKYYTFLIDEGFTRKDALVTFGGGILQDISGFIASTLFRGTKWIFFPTTLLAQADSCLGSKTSINFGKSKNLIGSFYPPDLVYIDPYLCKTLTDGYFNSGVGEIIKFHLLKDDKAYETLKAYLAEENERETELLIPTMKSTLAVKRSYFEQDEFDTGLRNLLNYGHCFGHALEAATQFEVCHGEAVIVGMGFANRISLRRGLMNQECFDELEAIFASRYPKFQHKSLKVEDIIYHMKRDKKRAGKDLTTVLLHSVGKAVKHDDILESEVKDAFAELFTGYPE